MKPSTRTLSKSNKLQQKARKLIPGGTNSGARATITRGVYEGFPVHMPSFIQSGKGSHVLDVDGNDYVDYILGFGPVILGHANPEVTQAVTEQLSKGILYAANTETEIKVSEKVIKHVPGADQLLITNTGSCADSIALKLARAYTGKQKVLKFEGHYHGWHDWNMVGNAYSVLGAFARGLGQKVLASDGVAQSVYDDVIVIPWNDPEALEETFRLHGNEIAAVITEGHQSNWGVIPPEKGYLELIRKLTKDNGSVFIMDEVITGFRLGLGGAQELFGVTPDISTFAKAMANGFPIAAVAGKKKVMESIADDKVWVAGTYNGNAVSATAALATISELEKKGSYKDINDRGRELMDGMRDALSDNGVPGIVQGPGPMLSVFFTDMEKIRFTREVYSIPAHPHIRRSAAFFDGLMRRNVLVSPARYGRFYLSFSHTKEDIQHTIEAAQEAIKEASRIK
jgi:glutamate-1-semialdehyde 2,1-aminomutase